VVRRRHHRRPSLLGPGRPLPLPLGVLGHEGSTVIVGLNGLRLLRYPDPYPASFDRVGKDYSGYVAFDKQQVSIAE
jgi:hypothetical protein